MGSYPERSTKGIAMHGAGQTRVTPTALSTSYPRLELMQVLFVQDEETFSLGVDVGQNSLNESLGNFVNK